MVVEQDCIDFMRRCGGGFDVIIADPPYNIGKDFGNDSDRQSMTQYLHWTKEWMNAALRLLGDTGLLYVYGFSEILAKIAAPLPLDKHRWLVWHYTNKTVPQSRFWQRSHESLLCLWRDEKPQLEVDLIREPYSKEHLNNVGKVRPATKSGRYSKQVDTQFKDYGGALPRDVIKVQTLAGKRQSKGHPTQKPMELSRKLILSAKRISNQVYIPFAGSGSECVAAMELGREVIATEINPDYVRSANTWIKETRDLNLV